MVHLSGKNRACLIASLNNVLPRDDPQALVDLCREILKGESENEVRVRNDRLLITRLWSSNAFRTLLRVFLMLYMYLA